MKLHSAQTQDVIIIGAGFAGMYALHKLRCLHFSTLVIEAGEDVGGTWYWNRYPGARCDIDSLDYQYSFSDDLQRDWSWTEKYATQPEIFAYARHVADRFDLRKDIRFGSRVTRAEFDAMSGRWTVTTDDGDLIMARFLIAGTGCLSMPTRPPFPGLDDFQGKYYHTAQWPEDGVDFTGKRVGVVGTGSSGIQSIPEIAKTAAHLTVFQRTANFTTPAGNEPLPDEVVRAHKADFAQIKAKARTTNGGVVSIPSEQSAMSVSPEDRGARYESLWLSGGFSMLGAYNDIMVAEDSNETLADFIRQKIRERVKDPKLAERLTPRGYPVGAKRICIDTEYYDTFNQQNVTLVDVRETPIVRLTKTGVETSSASFDLDIVVFAIGFDAMTGPLLSIDIRGVGGKTLKEAWVAGPTTFLGLSVAGFPNLFIVAGPGSPSVLTNMIMAIEQHVDWIAEFLAYLRDRGAQTAEAKPDAQAEWVHHVNAAAQATLFTKAGSWYMGANIEGKPRVFMPYCGGLGAYSQHCARVAASGYEGFVLRAADGQPLRNETDGSFASAIGADSFVDAV